MGDDNQGIFAGGMHFLKHLDQIVKAPQIDAGLGLVKDGQRGVSGDDGSNLDALQLAAGQAGVHITVDVVSRAQADFGEAVADIGQLYLASRGQSDEILHLDALEPDRLLEGEADAQLCPLGDVFVRNVRSVEQNSSGGRLFDSHDQFCKRGFAAAVGARDGDEGVIFKSKIQIPYDFLLSLGIIGYLKG